MKKRSVKLMGTWDTAQWWNVFRPGFNPQPSKRGKKCMEFQGNVRKPFGPLFCVSCLSLHHLFNIYTNKLFYTSLNKIISPTFFIVEISWKWELLRHKFRWHALPKSVQECALSKLQNPTNPHFPTLENGETVVNALCNCFKH
jgi:hypothetical protein